MEWWEWVWWMLFGSGLGIGIGWATHAAPDIFRKEKERRERLEKEFREKRKELVDEWQRTNEEMEERRDYMLSPGAFVVLEQEEPMPLDEGADYIDELLFKARKAKGNLPEFIKNEDEERAWLFYQEGKIDVHGLRQCIRGHVSINAIRAAESPVFKRAFELHEKQRGEMRRVKR